LKDAVVHISNAIRQLFGIAIISGKFVESGKGLWCYRPAWSNGASEILITYYEGTNTLSFSSPEIRLSLDIKTVTADSIIQSVLDGSWISFHVAGTEYFPTDFPRRFERNYEITGRKIGNSKWISLESEKFASVLSRLVWRARRFINVTFNVTQKRSIVI
jgi:hypothetical protein